MTNQSSITCSCPFEKTTGIYNLEKKNDSASSFKEQLNKMPVNHKVIGKYAPLTIDTPEAQ